MNYSVITELLLALFNTNGPVSIAMRQAHAEGRKLTAAELQAAFDQDNEARAELAAIVKGP